MTKSSTGLLAVCYKPPASLPPIPELAWTKWSHLGTFVQGAGHKLRVPRSQIFLRIIMINDNNNNGIQYTSFLEKKSVMYMGIDFPKAKEIYQKYRKMDQQQERNLSKPNVGTTLWLVCPKVVKTNPGCFSREHDINQQLFEYLPICAQIQSW